MQRSIDGRVKKLERSRQPLQELLGVERARSILNMFVKLGGLSPDDVTEEEIRKVASWPTSKGPLAPSIRNFFNEMVKK